MSDVAKMIESFVRAELAIQQIREKTATRVRQLRTEVKTCKEYLLGQMVKRKLTCMEVSHERLQELTYIRLKEQPAAETAFSCEDVVNLVFALPYDDTAETSPYAAIEAKASCASVKPSLKLSGSRERGANVTEIPSDMWPFALGLALAREELRAISAADSEAIAQFAATKNSVTPAIIEFLQNKEDHQQRLSVPEGSHTRTYIIKAIESTRAPKLRRRDVLDLTRPLLETTCDLDSRESVRLLGKQIREQFGLRQSNSKVSLALQCGPLT